MFFFMLICLGVDLDSLMQYCLPVWHVHSFDKMIISTCALEY